MFDLICMLVMNGWTLKVHCSNKNFNSSSSSNKFDRRQRNRQRRRTIRRHRMRCWISSRKSTSSRRCVTLPCDASRATCGVTSISFASNSSAPSWRTSTKRNPMQLRVTSAHLRTTTTTHRRRSLPTLYNVHRYWNPPTTDHC